MLPSCHVIWSVCQTYDSEEDTELSFGISSLGVMVLLNLLSSQNCMFSFLIALVLLRKGFIEKGTRKLRKLLSSERHSQNISKNVKTLLFHFFMLDTYGEKNNSLFPSFQQRQDKLNDSVIFCSYYVVSLFLLAGVFYEF